MQSKRSTILTESKIDYHAVRERKARMLKRFLLARDKAEKNGTLMIKPL